MYAPGVVKQSVTSLVTAMSQIVIGTETHYLNAVVKMKNTKT